ncbi:unnamed protein product [Gordionus sp. m RMFG-2023]|uniref:uncharacterized protein LOC135922406 n=1 Tax=Gordionus sp. m RMFG-2023 TaxID=3053472 RepID=UPI0030E53B00
MKEFTDYDLVLPNCKILKLNVSKKDIDNSETYSQNMRLDCLADKTSPLTYIDSSMKREENSKRKNALPLFKIKVNSTALRLHYGGDNNLEYCKYERILRDINSGNPDDSITYTKPVKFKFDVTVHINSTHFRKRDDANQNFDTFIRVRCFNNKSVIYRNVHIVVRESVSNYVMSQSSNKYDKSATPKFNVLLVGIDSTSNKNFERGLVKTYKYLSGIRGKKLFAYKGYVKIGENTYPNLNALLTGKYTWEFPNDERSYLDNISLIWHEYEKHGYSSIYLEDEPFMSTFNYIKYGFYKSPTHFYFRPFTLELRDTMSKLSSEDYCCVYGKNEVEMLLDYSKELIKEMERSNQPYFNLNFLTRYTHPQLRGIDDVDNLLVDYFKDLIESHHLKNTFIFLFGDHGLRFGSFRKTLNGMLEDRMPFLLAIPPDNFFTKYNQDETIFEANTRSLLAPFDFHKTLLDLLEISNIEQVPLAVTDDPGEYYTLYPSDIGNTRGISLLQPIPKDRTCESANIPYRYCPCNWIKLNPSQMLKNVSSDEDQLAIGISKLILYGVDLVLKKMKDDLSNYSSICLIDELNQHSIMNTILVANDKINFQDFQMLSTLNVNTNITKTGNAKISKILLSKIFGLLKGFLLVFKVLANEAVFETTLVFDKQNVSRIFEDPEILTLDYYETNSACMQIEEFKKYCRCRS